MKRIIYAALLLVCIVCMSATKVSAGEVEVLIDILVEKGILTPVEASIVLDETKQQVAKEVTESRSYALPKWVQNMKIKQDLRLRHQYERREADSDARSRFRIRYRMGVETKVVKNVKAGVGLATGSDDPRSTNQTLQDFFSTPDIRLDYAYAEWKPKPNAKLIGGKFKRKPYLWQPTDLLWDGDINPEGVSGHYQHDLTQNTAAFLNGGVWFLDENGKSDEEDPFMHYVQGGVSAKTDKYDGKVAVTRYDFVNVKNNTLDNSAGTNTTFAGGAHAFDFQSTQVSAEAGIINPFDLPVERVAVFGDYINNGSKGVVEDTGWAAGVKFGSKKVGKEKTWQGKYIYAHLEKDAFVDTFPDSDRYGGRTDVKGHEVILNYAIKKNVILGVDYYNVERILAADNREQLVQGDVLFKF